MAQYYLINSIRIGGSLLKCGSLIDSVSRDVAQVTNCGGALIPASVFSPSELATFQAGVENVMSMWANGRDQIECDEAMGLVVSMLMAQHEWTHDSVVSNTTGISTAKSTHTHTASIVVQQHFGALAAHGVAYHAAYTGAVAIDDSTGPWAQFLPLRTVEVSGDAGLAAASWPIDGTTADGNLAQDVIVHAGGATISQGAIAFKTITRVRSSVAPGLGGHATLQTGNGFGLGTVTDTSLQVGIDGALDTGATEPTPGTVIPSSAPNAAHVYTVVYAEAPVVASETKHTHGITDPGHTHAMA